MEFCTSANREVTFEWKNTDDVKSCAVYRKRDDGPLVLYKTLDGNIDKFVDKNISINTRYVYKFQLTYNGGIKSQLSREIPVVY